jgi:AcrR family transcriptional regulator
VTTEHRPRTRRDEQRERTRQELLDAAAVVFAKQGYHGASVDQVAEAAGFTKGAVYSNFRSKEELFLELLERQLDRSVELLEGVVDALPPDERIPAIVEATETLPILEGGWFLLEAEFLLYAARNEDPSVRQRVAARQQRTRERITAVVQRHLDDIGAEPAIAAEDITRLLTAAADGLTQAALVDETARDGGRILGLLIQTLLGSLAPPSR